LWLQSLPLGPFSLSVHIRSHVSIYVGCCFTSTHEVQQRKKETYVHNFKISSFSRVSGSRKKQNKTNRGSRKVKGTKRSALSAHQELWDPTLHFSRYRAWLLRFLALSFSTCNCVFAGPVRSLFGIHLAPTGPQDPTPVGCCS
jgi:hypothetical protein